MIVALSLGGGHLRAGEAVAAALRELAPDWEVRCIDLRDHMAPWLRVLYVSGYLFLIRHLPWLYGFLYRHPPSRGGGTLPGWMQRLGLGSFARLVGEWRPDVIVATQITASEAADRLRAIGAWSGATATIVTDFDAHPSWRADHIDRFYVPDEPLRQRFARLGIPIARIEATGVPIDPRFGADFDRAALRAKHGVRPDVPAVLLMGGSLGLGAIGPAVEQLVAAGRPLDLIVVTGHNTRLRRRLERLEPKGDGRLLLFGFVDFVAELMALADLFVSKPGGLSMTEALTVGVPTLVAAPLAGQEDANASHLEAQGVVRVLGPRESLADTVHTLLDDDPARHHLSTNAHAYAPPHPTHQIAHHIITLTQEHENNVGGHLS